MNSLSLWIAGTFTSEEGCTTTYEEIKKLCVIYSKNYDDVISRLNKTSEVINSPGDASYKGLRIRSQAKITMTQNDSNATQPPIASQLVIKTSPRRKYAESVVSQSTRLSDVKILKTKISQLENEKHELECRVKVLEAENEDIKQSLNENTRTDAEYDELHKQYRKLSDICEKQKEEITSMEDELVDLSESISELEHDKTIHEETIKRLRTEIKELKASQAKSNRALAAADKMTKKSPRSKK